MKGRGHIGLLCINGFYNTPFSSLEWERSTALLAGREGRGGGGGACLLIGKHYHFTPARGVRRDIKALTARNHPEGWGGEWVLESSHEDSQNINPEVKSVVLHSGRGGTPDPFRRRHLIPAPCQEKTTAEEKKTCKEAHALNRPES